MKDIISKYKEDIKRFRTTGEIETYYGSLFESGKAFDYRSVKDNLIFVITMKEKVDGRRLQEAVNRTVCYCPFITFSVFKDEGSKRFIYRMSDAEYKVFHKVFPFEYGTEETGGMFSFVSYQDDKIFFGISHAITDFGGQYIAARSLLEAYLGYEVAYKGAASDLYAADLMKYELPLSDGFKPYKYYDGEVFSIPEECSAPDGFTEALSMDKAAFDEFTSSLDTTRQISAVILLAEALTLAYPGNDKMFCFRCPVDCRKRFGIADSFQNASMPHAFLYSDPSDTEDLQGTAVRLSKELREQISKDELAYQTNSFARLFRDEEKKDILAYLYEFSLRTGILVSNTGKLFTEDKFACVKDFTVTMNSPFPLSLYVFEVNGKVKILYIQKFESREIFNSLQEVIKKRIGELL